MYDDWTKCTECQFFDPEKYYCKRLLHTVTIGCPYGEPKPATRYDLLVSKTPEELAEWIAQIADCCGNDYCGKSCPLHTLCWSKSNASTLDWLKQEVKE